MGKTVFIGQAEERGIGEIVRTGACSPRYPRVFKICLFVSVEVNVNGIERHQRRQRRDLPRAALDEVAFGNFRATDSAGDWRDDVRELQIELGATKCRLSRGDARFRGTSCRGPTVILFGRHAVIVVEALGTLKIILRARKFGLSLGQLSL